MNHHHRDLTAAELDELERLRSDQSVYDADYADALVRAAPSLLAMARAAGESRVEWLLGLLPGIESYIENELDCTSQTEELHNKWAHGVRRGARKLIELAETKEPPQ